MALLTEIGIVIWALIPAFVPSIMAPIFSGGGPIDGGKTWRDNRLLGDGTTWFGFIGGTIWGVVFAPTLNTLNVAVFNSTYPVFSVEIAFILAFGAMLGSLFGAFVKRRMAIETGSSTPMVDQLDSLMGALILTVVVFPTWVTTLPRVALVSVISLTILVYLGGHSLAFALGVKNTP